MHVLQDTIGLHTDKAFFAFCLRLDSLAWKSPLVIRFWKNLSAAAPPPNKSGRIGDEVLRLASSIQQGTVTASLMLRKLGAYPRKNELALALREIGKLERTLFLLEYIQNVELRKRIHAGLNKGEARNALARAVFFNRLGGTARPLRRKPAASSQWLKSRTCH
jgi:TnpA family transposase